MRPWGSGVLFGICWGATGYSSLLSGWLCRDGFTVMFPYLPGGLDDFVEHVIPELQRRGLFQRDYEGTTLREHLRLPRPQNRFFPD